MSRKLYAAVFAILLAPNVNAQVSVSSGTTMKISSGTTVKAPGNVEIQALGNLTNEGVLEFGGTLNNVGNAELTGVVTANGDELQLIDGADSFAIRNFRINNTSGVKLNTKVAITNTLTLERGLLYTDDVYPVYFTGNSLSPLETVDGYINGTAILDPRYTGTSFNFLGFDVRNGTGEDVGMFWLKRKTGGDAAVAIGEENSISASWEPRNESPGGSDIGPYDITLSWLPAFDNSKDLGSLALYGTTKHNPSLYTMLDNKVSPNVTVDEMSELRSYKRKSLDHLNRKLTLSGKNAMDNTVPKISITTFPNPASDHINFLLQNMEPWATDVVVKITDAYGKMIGEYVFVYDGNLITVSGIGHLQMGVYRAFISRGQITSVVNFYKN